MHKEVWVSACFIFPAQELQTLEMAGCWFSLRRSLCSAGEEGENGPGHPLLSPEPKN